MKINYIPVTELRPYENNPRNNDEAVIVYIMNKIVGSDVIVYAEGEHSCVTARGIKKQGTVTKSISYSGKFNTESFRRSFFEMLR